MNVRRFHGATAREAMRQVRDELGDEAVILKNRQIDGGVEILAVAAGSIGGDAEPAMPGAAASEDRAGPANDSAARFASDRDRAMSTVLFETYVRERRKRRMEEEVREAGRGRAAEPPRQVAPAVVAAPAPAPVVNPPAQAAPAAVRMPVHAPSWDNTPQPRAESELVRELMNEIRDLRGSLSNQIESIRWFEGVRRNPVQARLLRLLLQSGFSAALSRMMADNLPAHLDDTRAMHWLREVIVRNLRVDEPGQSLFDGGGTFALMGPTGVGKTTTAAKIAAQFALKHGAQSVGLITADVYRIGAQDQLKTFGRMLGVPVHVAHDVSSLAGFLQLFVKRKLVLIDTAGVGQRDERVSELLSSLQGTSVRKVLVLNAAMQTEGIEEVMRSYRASESAGVVLSKVDETVRLGGAVDCMIRHRLRLVGIANGQRVPEDWHRADARTLAERILAEWDPRRTSAFSYEEAELAMLAAQARQGAGAMGARGV